MSKTEFERHPLVFRHGLLAFEGYGGDMLCMVANGDNNFLLHGIAENSILVVDPKKKFRKGKLNVFQTDGREDIPEPYKLSKTKLKDCSYFGRVVVSINQFT